MTQPLSLSIITPSYNQGRFIERTINSVLAQNIPSLEYIVVDGGSKDETLEILNRYSSQLRYISEADNGQADAVNKGLDLTSGEIIGWLNSDDIYYPNACKTIIDFFAAHPDVDVVYGQAYHINENDQIINQYRTEPWNFERLKRRCYISQPAVFFRRSVISRFGKLNTDLNFCLDYEYWIRLGLKGAKFVYFPKILAATRLYPETKTCGFRIQAQKESIAMLKNYFGVVPWRWCFSYMRAMLLTKTFFNISHINYLVKVVTENIQSISK